MSERFTQLRKEKELIKMREALMSDWRGDLTEDKEEEHPYVDVMPSTDQKEKDAKEKKKEKKEDKEEKEEVKEDYEGYDYVGKEGKQHKVSNGISTKHLNNKEFGEFSRQKMGRKKLDLKKPVKEGYKPMPHEANELQMARHRDHARAALKAGDTEKANKSLDREAALKSPSERKLDLAAKKEEQNEKKRRDLFTHKEETSVSEGKEPHSGADFARQERDDAMRDHQIQQGLKRLDLGKHKKNKKK